MSHPLITDELRTELLANGARAAGGKEIDPYLVLKLFTPDAGWLLTELDPIDPDLAFGLCDLGVGYPELGYVRLSEIASVRGVLGLPVERDLFFKADRPLSRYARRRRDTGARCRCPRQAGRRRRQLHSGSILVAGVHPMAGLRCILPVRGWLGRAEYRRFDRRPVSSHH